MPSLLHFISSVLKLLFGEEIHSYITSIWVPLQVYDGNEDARDIHLFLSSAFKLTGGARVPLRCHFHPDSLARSRRRRGPERPAGKNVNTPADVVSQVAADRMKTKRGSIFSRCLPVSGSCWRQVDGLFVLGLCRVSGSRKTAAEETSWSRDWVKDS